MSKIKDLREREIYRLATFKNENPTADDIAEARTMMRAYYNLCGICEKNLYLANDARTCDLKATRESEEREALRHKRLNEKFNNLYGLSLVYCGYLPSIGTIRDNGGFSEKIYAYFY